MHKQHVILQTFVQNMFSMQPLMCPHVYLANGSLGRSFTLIDCLSASDLANKSKTHTQTRGHTHKHTVVTPMHAVTNTHMLGCYSG